MEYRLQAQGFMEFFAIQNCLMIVALQNTPWNPGVTAYIPWIKYIYLIYIIYIFFFFFHKYECILFEIDLYQKSF